jgi:hypothetical protein
MPTRRAERSAPTIGDEQIGRSPPPDAAGAPGPWQQFLCRIAVIEALGPTSENPEDRCVAAALRRIAGGFADRLKMRARKVQSAFGKKRETGLCGRRALT